MADAQPRAQVLVALRVFGVPLPRLLWPKLEVGESAEGSLYRFMVRVELRALRLDSMRVGLRPAGTMRFEKIVVLTGAGLSAESGLATFRDQGGLWSEFDLEEVATPEGFVRNPATVHAF